MNINRITLDLTVHPSSGGNNTVHIPRVGAVHFRHTFDHIEVFEDERSGILHAFAHSPRERCIKIMTFVPNEARSYGEFCVECGLYDRFVSEYEHQNGLSLHRMQSIIWVMGQMASAERQHQAEEAA